LIKPPAGSPLDRGNSSGTNNAKNPHTLPAPGIISATTTPSNSHLPGKTSLPKKKTVSESAKASPLPSQTDNITSQEKKESNTTSDTRKISSVGFVADFDSTSAERTNLSSVGFVAEFDETAALAVNPPSVAFAAEFDETSALAVNPPSVGFAAEFDNFADDLTQTKTNMPNLNLNDASSTKTANNSFHRESFFPTPFESVTTAVPKEATHFIDNKNKATFFFEETVTATNIKASASSSSSSSESSMRSLEYEVFNLLSQEVRTSAATAIIQGPPAARHFGGNQGGLVSTTTCMLGGVNTTSVKSANRVGSIAICGAKKTVMYSVDRGGTNYPFGASGAIICDSIDDSDSQYLCCFLAKEKKLVVLELSGKTMVVEMKMTTKLNFWRCLPPEADGDTVVFMLITPIGGFHWMPLDNEPRPHQVWKRGTELQGKKIVLYEEGGSNGERGRLSKSTDALLLVLSGNDTPAVEAWCLKLRGQSIPLLVSSDILGGALMRPKNLGLNGSPFHPLICSVEMNVMGRMILQVQDVYHEGVESIEDGIILAQTAIGDDLHQAKDNLTTPSLAMGSSPQVLVLCHDNVVVTSIRNEGFVSAFRFMGGSLELIGRKNVDHFIIDAAIQPDEAGRKLTVVLLLCDSVNQKDGRIAKLYLSFDESAS